MLARPLSINPSPLCPQFFSPMTILARISRRFLSSFFSSLAHPVSQRSLSQKFFFPPEQSPPFHYEVVQHYFPSLQRRSPFPLPVPIACFFPPRKRGLSPFCRTLALPFFFFFFRLSFEPRDLSLGGSPFNQKLFFFFLSR